MDESMGAAGARPHVNWPVARLVEAALARGEGVLSESGALVVSTAPYTGRSPSDRYLVRAGSAEEGVDWGPVNRPMAPEHFEGLWERAWAYLKAREHFCFTGYAGAHPHYRVPVRAACELAWQALFLKQMLLGGDGEAGSAGPGEGEGITLIAVPNFPAEPARDGTDTQTAIALDLDGRRIVVAGTRYAGELKKAIFTILNYIYPQRGVLPMHCAANVGADGDVALFFGLSGTGKTTLSADPERYLLGDDEHGWAAGGVFNFEGGCYAKTIGLSPQREPLIWHAIRFGALLENVDLDPATRAVRFESARITENTRAAFPLEHIPSSLPGRSAGHPRCILFLSADASGVLPPVARLSSEQAMYYFLTGYTSKLAGTERGISEPVPTFSACFGAPFLPRHPRVYARLLGERIGAHRTRVYLINTGWTGGPYGVGRRIDLAVTRAIVRAAIRGELDPIPTLVDPHFGFAVPTRCPGIDAKLLNPRATWEDQEAYDRAAVQLAARFIENMEGLGDVPLEIVAAGPRRRA